MSIHTEISDEAKQRLAAQKRNATISSIVVSIMTLVLIALVLGYFLLPNYVKEVPTIVTYKSPQKVESTDPVKKVTTSIQRKPTSPSSSQAKVIAVAAASSTSIPVPDVSADVESVDFGDAMDFGSGWGEDIGTSDGGATFFEQEVNAERIAFVIDYSASMHGGPEALMRSELKKSVEGLSAGTSYQLFFFAGPVWVGGDTVVRGEKVGGVTAVTTTTPEGDVFNWEGFGGPRSYRQIGPARTSLWLEGSSKNIRKSLQHIDETGLTLGTAWEPALTMALAMDPPPQVIFFMTDGVSGSGEAMEKTIDKISSEARRKDVIINSVAMMQPRAIVPLGKISYNTGGLFTIVEENGEAREVTEAEVRQAEQ